MRRRAVIAGCGAALLAASGCALMPKRAVDGPAPAAHSAACQQLSQAAQAAIDHHDYGRAEAELRQLAAQAPGSAEARHRLGHVLQLEGRPAEAVAEYRKALELDPDYVSALISLGRVEAELGRYDEALQRFDAAIEIDPHQAEAHFAAGKVLEQQGRPDEALAAYFRALELDPSASRVVVRAASIQLAQGQAEQAVARLDQVLGLTPDDPEARFRRGLALVALRRLPAAIDDLRFAAEHLEPRRAEAYYQLALALEAARRLADAREAADRAIKLSPAFADARALSQRLRR